MMRKIAVCRRSMTNMAILLCGCVCFASGPAAVQAQPLRVDATAYSHAGVAALPLPPPEVQTILVQSTLGALNQANLTNDYSVFLKLASTDFQALNSQSQLSRSFAGFREANIDLGALVLYPIRWSHSPSIEQGALHLIGTLPSSPQMTTFDIVYVIERDRWRVAAITVGLEHPHSSG